MIAYREDIRARMEKYGRDPDSCKLLFVVSPVLADTIEDAQRQVARMREASDWNAETALAHLSALTENDFSEYDLDAPVPKVTTNGHRSTLDDFLRAGDGMTLRQAAANWNINSVELVGTPETVAERMGEVMAEVGGDGFLISGAISRQYIGQITEGLMPALQRRGLVRTEYTHPRFRDNLMEY
jgi:alkanesulfonate monooxygenase SsuD/methylene tetrahydromethanopterin reductase-like flavin-dependent oxidoreductase (luciferase family)